MAVLQEGATGKKFRLMKGAPQVGGGAGGQGGRSKRDGAPPAAAPAQGAVLSPRFGACGSARHAAPRGLQAGLVTAAAMRRTPVARWC